MNLEKNKEVPQTLSDLVGLFQPPVVDRLSMVNTIIVVLD